MRDALVEGCGWIRPPGVLSTDTKECECVLKAHSPLHCEESENARAAGKPWLRAKPRYVEARRLADAAPSANSSLLRNLNPDRAFEERVLLEAASFVVRHE